MSWFGDAIHAVEGAVHTITHGVSVVVHRLVRLPNFVAALIGYLPERKLRLAVLILRRESKGTTATRDDLVDAVKLAQRVYRDEANVKIIAADGSDEFIVQVLPVPAPDYVLRPQCDGGGFEEAFGRIGAWFRHYKVTTPLGVLRGDTVTIYVVDDVQGKAGCWIPFAGDYGFIDAGALLSDTGSLLTLAHETGHACDLWHQRNKSLMEADPGPRTGHLTRFQRAWLRSSPHVSKY